MTPAHPLDVNSIANFQNLIQAYNERIVEEKAARYSLAIERGDLVDQKRLLNLLTTGYEVEMSFGVESDLSKSIGNSFKRRLLRRSSQLIDRFSMSD
jgi:hypothetical protein